MTTDQRNKLYTSFSQELLEKKPYMREDWLAFNLVEALWSLFSWCLESKGEDVYILFLKHLAFIEDKENNLGNNTSLVFSHLSSISEQGRSLSFSVNTKETNNIFHSWLALSSFGNKLLLFLLQCKALNSLPDIASGGRWC